MMYSPSLPPVRWVHASVECCDRDSIGREDTDVHSIKEAQIEDGTVPAAASDATEQAAPEA